MNKNNGKHWYNNGEVQVMRFECPDGFKPGALPVKNNEEVVKKRRQTCLERHGNATYNNPEKNKQTCLKHFGYEYASQAPVVKQKVKTTLVSNFGESYGKVLFNKSLETIKKRTGIKDLTNVSQLEETKQKVKQTCLKKYGQPYYLGCDEYLEKTKQTCLARYGVTNVSQAPEIVSKKHKKFIIDGVYLDSQWELDVYNFCRKNNLKVERNIPFSYTLDNKVYKTFIDFKIEGYLLEVKGTHLLYGVFDNQRLKEKIKIWQDNNVIIVTSDICYKEWLNDFFEKNKLTGLDIKWFQDSSISWNQLISMANLKKFIKK